MDASIRAKSARTFAGSVKGALYCDLPDCTGVVFALCAKAVPKAVLARRKGSINLVIIGVA